MTMESVLKQTYRNIEYIIVDGASTDESVDVIREMSASLNDGMSRDKSLNDGVSILWSSEPDRGIYDAMNKGIKKATGEYLYFLNSGDVLANDNVLETIVNLLGEEDIIIGRVNKVANERIIDQTKLMTEGDMSLYQMYLHGINHQSAIIRCDTQIKYMYDDTLKIGADWKFFVQAIVLDSATTKFVDMTIANYDMSGVSSNIEKLRNERKAILESLIPERIARDYLAVAPHYYEVVRLQWLLEHPFWYKIYRGLTTFGRKICNL